MWKAHLGLWCRRTSPRGWTCIAGLAFVAATFSCLAPVVDASSAGPPPARTGGFGEMTCHECHWENPINDPSGSLTLSGVPPTYTPGEAYTITISVAHADTKRAGFELSARVDGPAPDSPAAGQLRPLDALTQVMDEKGIPYVSQTDAGSKAVSATTGRWTFEWKAPSSGEPVVFHVAANAANGDASPLGDSVYTSVARTRSR